MRILTIMDYNKEPYITMAKGWLYLARKYHADADIIVYHGGNISKELIQDGIIYKKLDTKGVPVLAPGEPGKVNKLAMHKEWKKYDKFLFMDADAYPLSSLKELYDSCTKPITMCGHEQGYGCRILLFFHKLGAHSPRYLSCSLKMHPQ